MSHKTERQCGRLEEEEDGGKTGCPQTAAILAPFVVVGSRMQPTTGQGSNLVHQSSPRPGTLIYACQEKEKKAQGTQAHSRPNTRNDHSHNNTFTHRRRSLPCKATDSSSGAVRVRCLAQGHLDTLARRSRGSN